MKNDSTHLTRRAMLSRSTAGLLAALAGAFSVITPQASAHPPLGQNRRVARRTSRRTSRRVSRRHMYGMPPGARPFAYGGYNYFLAGGIYYYPYMLSGRTVYVQVDVSGGRPLPPPPPAQVSVEIDL